MIKKWNDDALTVMHADREGFLPSGEASALGKRQPKSLKVAPIHVGGSYADRYYFQPFFTVNYSDLYRKPFKRLSLAGFASTLRKVLV